jgi:hypothetical protein
MSAVNWTPFVMKRGWPSGVIAFLNMSRRSRLTTFHDLQLLMMVKSIEMRLVYVEWYYLKIHGYISIYKSKEAHPMTRASRITVGSSVPLPDAHKLTYIFSQV